MLKINIPKHSLYITLGIIIVSTIIIIMSIHSTYTYVETKNMIIQKIKYDSSHTIVSLQNNITNLIASYSINEYDNLILNEMQQKDNFAIIVEDYNMGEILGTGSYISGKILDAKRNIIDFDSKDTQQLKQLQNCYYSEKQDIVSPLGKKLGTVSVYISDYSMNIELNKIITNTIINTFTISALLILLLFIIIRFFIFKPLSDIIKVINHSDEDGIPIESIPDGGSTEISTLSNTMNSMISSIRDSRIAIKNKTKELEKFKDDLEDLVALRTEELRQTQAHMAQTEKMAALGGLVAGVAHEINTPIGLGITSMTHFVSQTEKLKKLYEDEEMQQEDFEKYIQNSSKLATVTYENLKRAAELVKSFKQISIDQTSEQKRKFNLKEYIKETILSIHNRIKQTNIEVQINCPDDLDIFSYPGAFSQIVTNLIMNSLTHGYDKNDSGIINLDFNMKDSMLQFTYKDDGKGISKENLTKIFDPFFTTNRADGGSGLGLNIIYNIVSGQLGGTIECKSEEGNGAEFIISVPFMEDEELQNAE